jgi:PIN domain nuclease of toxin-antitoxin system
LISSATVWEIAIKRATGKLAFAAPIVETVERLGFELLTITGAHAEHAGGLPRHHGDPFDRMLIAQVALEGLVLGTQDPVMRRYAVPLLGLA